MASGQRSRNGTTGGVADQVEMLEAGAGGCVKNRRNLHLESITDGRRFPVIYRKVL